MGTSTHTLTIGCRVTEREQARVDAAARLRGLTRAEYLRLAALDLAEDDLRQAACPIDEGAALAPAPRSF